MIKKTKTFTCFLVISFLLGIPVNVAYAQGAEALLNWKIQTSKEMFYPGEPVLLTLEAENTGNEEAKVDFGWEGIEAFAIEIKNSSNEIVMQGDHVMRFGASARSNWVLSPGKTNKKSIVLNQWCSTLLPPGQYKVVCRVDRPGEFYFEKIQSADDENYTVITKRRYLPMVALELDIQIVSANDSKFKAILKHLAKRASMKTTKNINDGADRNIAREMIAFSESALAIPHQLELLRISRSTRVKSGAIDSLVKSKKLDAACGLKNFFEDPSNYYKDDVKNQIIEAVHKLRESGKADILNATNEFVAKHKRPISAKRAN